MFKVAKEEFFFNDLEITKNQTAYQNHVKDRSLYLLLKRVFDVLFSLLTIIFLLSWLIPLLAIIIKLDSPGPVFFIQKRIGFLGKTFRCIKFRTMVVNHLSDHQQALSNDPRITRLGKFLRITSLDELPQFFNVLLGDMTIVGPRPHMHTDNENFNRIVSNYQLRYYAKPGITGMAQVKGYRGPVKDFYSIFHRYQWDAFYVRNASFVLDFKIIHFTVIQVVKSIFTFKSDSKKEVIQDLIKGTPDLVFAQTGSPE